MSASLNVLIPSRVKEYRGKIGRDGQVSVTVDGEPLPLRIEVVNHSPSGFSWGYPGSGPSQLALSVMCEEFGDATEGHPVSYHRVKDLLICRLPEEQSWVFSSHDIYNVVNIIMTT
jgi:uncharacterized protein (DUF2249 family)